MVARKLPSGCSFTATSPYVPISTFDLAMTVPLAATETNGSTVSSRRDNSHRDKPPPRSGVELQQRPDRRRGNYVPRPHRDDGYWELAAPNQAVGEVRGDIHRDRRRRQIHGRFGSDAGDRFGGGDAFRSHGGNVGRWRQLERLSGRRHAPVPELLADDETMTCPTRNFGAGWTAAICGMIARMRIAAISDVHGNALALGAVLEAIRHEAVDMIVNLGDHLSGAVSPALTAKLLMATPMVSIRGNHERQLLEWDIGRMGDSDRRALRELNDDSKRWLQGLPPTAEIADGVFAFHGTPEATLSTFWRPLPLTGSGPRASTKSLAGSPATSVTGCCYAATPTFNGRCTCQTGR